MPWFFNSNDMLDTMADLAADPEKLAAFKATPEQYLNDHTDLTEEQVNAILSQDHETVLRSLMSKVDDES